MVPHGLLQYRATNLLLSQQTPPLQQLSSVSKYKLVGPTIPCAVKTLNAITRQASSYSAVRPQHLWFLCGLYCQEASMDGTNHKKLYLDMCEIAPWFLMYIIETVAPRLSWTGDPCSTIP